ncbi:fumarylacetoacetate hydrolase family protein [Thermoproteus tenax]|uniref:2-hydroxyhepta-2,4-diene-1,7-dioate isomerase n=1 Tax=Thermoproteus tenax (strain ATCC 35583 / DSM 2078 / JCM 9277 / NBRC 100435 / Kra 1) TaxID=768679 RepID=G4RNS3_THETK|nr:fumarylacetoacetate hydrolase family protein [Thermoproteus tenax]CCC81217.1 2-hydroxyhepta-2,4-diene-1,7-dioate isomerase [Thermoproteus tenax Kra 1]
MKLLTYSHRGVRKVGAYVEGAVVDLAEAYKAVYGAEKAPDFLYDMKDLISAGEPALRIAREVAEKASGEHYLDPRSIVWEPPVVSPEKILAVAVNYKSHGREMGHAPPPRPYFFPKFPNALVGHERPIIKHRIVQKMDWEVELVVIIGRSGKYIPKESALDYVFGYTVGNDISMRDWQYPPTELGLGWIWGKSMDTAAPVGPYIVTADEIGDPNKLGLRLYVNGVLEQEGNTADLIFNIQDLIHWASQGITLKPGDMIFTGTPPGVGHAKGKYLKDGDVVEAEVEGIGVLRNYVIEEK